MEPARSIGRLGFKRWYERQLIEGHAWLVTCFLCGIAIAASLESLSFRDSPRTALLTAGFAFVAGLLCWHGLRRYRDIMIEAERLAEHSVCEACRTYARYTVVGEYPKLCVRCRVCNHEWTVD